MNIAYFTVGEGTLPVVWFELRSQLTLERKLFPGQARNYKTISNLGTVIRYDLRSCAMSDREDCSITADDLANRAPAAPFAARHGMA